MNTMKSGAKYIPLGESELPRFRLLLPFSKVAWFTVLLPFSAFTFCVIWSILYNFELSTYTHCKVYNFLPSVSAAIGHYRPQKDVWKAAVAVQAVIRVLVLIMYYEYYKGNVYHWARGICNFALTTYAIENTSLVTLSFWSSNENYALHKLSFITFLITSLVYMFLTWYITKNCQNISKTSDEEVSHKWKYRLMLANISAIFAACYFFYRHNTFCEPLVYSMFALAEYLVVLSNMGFHMTAALDFANRSVLISRNGFRII
ncbi:post-GPI attachment to proteins factor 2 [Orussus abietinus]|uniref:post-GPI attachment to proteins factor 2 n=1 Tax=Orussus abietinus TaxID=222816 RepID=UPI0006259371|nr:post-GPI attachment to proteins factor 2 [Orussus abietinus]